MRLDDGHPTTVEFSENSGVLFWEKEVTPPGFDGGGANDTSTMRNVQVRTKAPKKLIEMTDMSLTVAYDPAVYPQILAMANVNQQITTTFADGSSLVVWGWLNSFQPGSASEGSQPTADVNVICSNQDDTGAEVLPVFNPAP